MDKEMLEAIGQMLDAKLAANNEALRTEMSQMMDAKLEPIKAELAEVKQKQDEQAAYERGTRAIIESRVMPAIRTVAEQHGEIIDRIKRVEARRENSQALRSHVRTLEDVVRSHTERIEALEAKAE